MAKEEKKKKKNKSKSKNETGATSGLSMNSATRISERPVAEKKQSTATYFNEVGLYKVKVLTCWLKPHHQTQVPTAGFTCRVVETSAEGVKKGMILTRAIVGSNNFKLDEIFELVDTLAAISAEDKGKECDEKFVEKFRKKMEKLDSVDDSSGQDLKFSKVAKGLILGVEVSNGKEMDHKPGSYWSEVNYGIMP